MEFVAASELKGILEDNDLEQLPPENDCIFLGMRGDEVTRHHFAPADGEAPVSRPVADGAIVGTSLKVGGRTEQPVDAARAAELAAAVKEIEE